MVPYKGKPNQIHVNSEAHMKHTVTELEGKNEPINFAHSVLGNYFLETDHGCYEAQPSEMKIDTQSELLPCNQTDDNACIVLKELGYCIINPPVYTNIWTMFFDGSKSQYGVGKDVSSSIHINIKCTHILSIGI
jgi:hypothetical protein